MIAHMSANVPRSSMRNAPPVARDELRVDRRGAVVRGVRRGGQRELDHERRGDRAGELEQDV
jgi:hypothetical protein